MGQVGKHPKGLPHTSAPSTAPPLAPGLAVPTKQGPLLRAEMPLPPGPTVPEVGRASLLSPWTFLSVSVVLVGLSAR